MTNEIRRCIRDGSEMELLAGWFALVGVQEPQIAQGAGLLGAALRIPRATPDGRFLGVRTWRCGACRMIELVDTEQKK